MRLNGVRPALLLAVIALSACTKLQPYHACVDDDAGPDGKLQQKHARIEANDCDVPGTRTCVSFVEFDDFGHLYNRGQLDQAITSATGIASRKVSVPGKDSEPKLVDHGGIIVVYVHGWHHDAHEGDRDVQHFRSVIEDAGRLDNEAYGDNRQIMGIYVGWRGESVTMPGLSTLSFWDRKNTAHAVGNGSVYELFRKLALIRQAYPTSRLVIVGHSFGAAVTNSAISHSAVAEILDAPPNDGAPIDLGKQKKRWDMVVLVNPAFEALQVRPAFEAARSRDYAQGQLPLLMYITSEADWATRLAFPAGRDISTVFKKYGDDVSSEMNRTAIGHYIPYVTHQLALNPDKCTNINRGMKRGDRVENSEQRPQYCFADPRALRDVETGELVPPAYLTRCDNDKLCAEVAPGHHIARGPLSQDGSTTEPMPVGMPIMNIRTTKDIMTDHDDIWNPKLKGFLVQFLLMTVTDNDTDVTKAPSSTENEKKQSAIYAVTTAATVKPEIATNPANVQQSPTKPNQVKFSCPSRGDNVQSAVW